MKTNVLWVILATLYLPLAAACVATPPLETPTSIESHSISLVVNNPPATLATIHDLALTMEGRIDGWTIDYNAFPYLGVNADHAWISLRVPRNRAGNVIDRILHLAGDITYCQTNRRDISQELDQLRGTISDLGVLEAELLETAQASPSLRDSLSAYSQLLDIRKELHKAQTEVAHLGEESSFVTIGVDLLPTEVGPIEPQGPCTDRPSP